VIQTCTQCGAINGAEARVCCFCDASLYRKNPEDISAPTAARDGCAGADEMPSGNPLANRPESSHAESPHAASLLPESSHAESSPAESSEDSIGGESGINSGSDWHGELTDRLAAFRARSQGLRADAKQPAFPFEPTGEMRETTHAHAKPREIVVKTAPPASPLTAISSRRTSRREARWEDHLEIDIAQPMLGFQGADYYPSWLAGPTIAKDSRGDAQLASIAPLGERACAGVLDAAVLLFAYGGFLALFWVLGGRFAWSRLDAVVTVATLGLVYAQYYLLFTIFGGTTPGMMMRRLRVVSFDGGQPTTSQLLWRAAGYLASACAGMLGFLWALWDRDHLTWQDRISHTYLTQG
jgi:uncharacterized RDD family membrane protein YckC